ncbi:VanZ family protein [Streptomyces sp. MJP52]|uniref:VanZ family protein n=1 Tax=Streptomyces sp. MJP52 TaxID=2940555 RepID=UPI0024744DDD|nr:VanZ family protein [Streptomyces sp. MJP52]MDH6225855.1 glycopeptide antibiotics resistance protein [Streptomyces sp. MJP52]
MDIRFEVAPTFVLGPLLVVFALFTGVQVWRDAWNVRHALLRTAAAVHAAAVLSLTIFPLNVTWGIYANQAPWTGQIHFVPLFGADVTMIPNVIMMIPAGFLFPLLSRHATSAKRTALLTGLVSLGIEAAQLLSYVVLNNGRSVDVNDVIANTLGGLLGHLLLTFALRSEALRGPLLAASLPRSAALQADRRRITASSGGPVTDPVPGHGR